MKKSTKFICRTVTVFLALLLCTAFLLTGCEGITAPDPQNTGTNSTGGLVLATKAPSGPTGTAGQSTPETTGSGPSDATPEASQAPATEPPTEPPVTEPPVTEQPATPTPYVNTFIDVNAEVSLYITPGETITVDIGGGDPSSWSSGNTSVIKLSAENGSLKAQALGTGYSVLTGKGGNGTDRIVIYSLKPAERTETNKVKDGLPYYLYYEKESHTLTVYKADSEGYYTVPCRTICAACGSTPSKTPTGIHKLGEKMRWKKFSDTLYASYGIAYASGVWLHGTCFNEEKPNTIVTHYYNSIGENSTGGCIRMQVGHIYWIYENCPEGTVLEIVNGAPRGTSSIKPDPIPEAAAYDPTDPVLAGRT